MHLRHREQPRTALPAKRRRRLQHLRHRPHRVDLEEVLQLIMWPCSSPAASLDSPYPMDKPFEELDEERTSPHLKSSTRKRRSRPRRRRSPRMRRTWTSSPRRRPQGGPVSQTAHDSALAECWVACGAGAYPWLDMCRGAVGASRCWLPSFMITNTDTVPAPVCARWPGRTAAMVGAPRFPVSAP